MNRIILSLFYTTTIANNIMGLLTYPSARMFHNVIKQGDTLWMLGGLEKPDKINRTCADDLNGNIADGIWKYNTKSKIWNHEDIGFPKRKGSTMVANNNYIYVHGGGISNKQNPIYTIPYGDTWRYNFKKRIWEEIGANNPYIYIHQSVITEEGYIYSLGGFDKMGKSIYMYIFNGNKWEKEIAKPFANTGIWGHTMTLISNRYIYVIGGVLGSPTEKNDFNKNVWIYDILTKTWQLHCEYKPLYGHGVCKFKNNFIITGGFYPTEYVINNEGSEHLDGTLDNIDILNLKTKKYKTIGKLKEPKEFHSSILCNNTINIFGGYHIGYFQNDEYIDINSYKLYEDLCSM